MPKKNQSLNKLSHFEKTLSILDLFQIVHYDIFELSIDDSGLCLNKLIKDVLAIRQCSRQMRDVVDKIYQPLFVELKNIEAMTFQEFCLNHSKGIVVAVNIFVVGLGIVHASIQEGHIDPWWRLAIAILVTLASFIIPLNLPFIYANSRLATAFAQAFASDLNHNNESLYLDMPLMIFTICATLRRSANFMEERDLNARRKMGTIKMDKSKKTLLEKVNFFNKQFCLFKSPKINKAMIMQDEVKPVIKDLGY